MRKLGINTLVILMSMIIFLSGCQLVEGIFKAGVWVGILMVVVVIAIVGFIISKIL